MTRPHSDHSKAAIDDPAWVLEKYREAKELIDELYHDDVVMRAVNGEMRDDIEAFWASTFMDTCTTFGADCSCNERYAEAIERQAAHSAPFGKAQS